MNDEISFKVSWCPVCRQGWIKIAKEKDSKKLFIYCEECEIEWDSPEYIKNENAGYFGKYGKAESPTYEEIVRNDWHRFLLRK